MGTYALSAGYYDAYYQKAQKAGPSAPILYGVIILEMHRSYRLADQEYTSL